MSRGSREREQKHMWRALERVLLRALGRPVVCAECGQPMFRALPIVRNGRLRVLGAFENLVRVSFDTKDTLEFRHGHLDECPSPERPWAR